MSNARTRTINITVPRELLKQVDALAKRDYTSRSDIIRQALLDKIRRPANRQLDEWGDPIGENWQTVVDFRDKNGSGVPIEDLIAAIDEHVK